MANYTGTQFSIVSATTDAGNDSTAFQAQSTAPFTITVKNILVSLGNVTAAAMGIVTSLRAGWLTGRRPVTGQLFPRGVYNR